VNEPDGYDGSAPVSLDPTKRAGLLTQPSVLAVHAHYADTAPVPRGIFVRFVRTNLLCDALPPPPPGVDTTLPDLGPGASKREIFAAHEADPACNSCHRLIDPIGLAFENYDAVGRFHTHEDGEDPSSASSSSRRSS
jgi:hypothetical protein